MNTTLIAFLIVAAAVLIFLCTKRWFWKIVFAGSAIACLFSLIASVIHFQILWAMGFLILTAVFALIFGLINGDD